MESIHSSDMVSDVDPVIALTIDAIRLAILDYRKGPSGSAKQQRDYFTAMRFLQRTGLLVVVEEYYRMKVDDGAEALIDECV